MVHLEGTALEDFPPSILCEMLLPGDSITFLAMAQLPSGWDDPGERIAESVVFIRPYPPFADGHLALKLV